MMLNTLEKFVYHYNGFNHIRNIIIEKLGIKDVILVETQVDDNDLTLKLMGKAASECLFKTLHNGDIIGLTGGTSVHSIVNNMDKKCGHFNNITIVPARGGLGSSTKYQANTLVEEFANKFDVNFFPLYTPDFLSEESIKTLKEEPNIKRAINYIEKIDYLIFGIGKADEMAKRRELQNDVYDKIISLKAVSEAFGYFFNDQGEIVHEISTIGITLEKFKKLKRLIAIAGGIDKAQAIVSVSKINSNLVLVTDVECAKEIINIIGGKI